MGQPESIPGRHLSLPTIRRVAMNRPVYWLQAGLADFFANPLPSLAYGLLFSLGGGLALLASLVEPYLFIRAVSGFFLVAPLLAAGFYELSRMRAAGANGPGFMDAFTGLRRCASTLALFGLALALVAMAWGQVTAIAFDVLADLEIGLDQFILVLTSGEHRAFMAIWFIIGASLALVVFACSAITVPIILDRDADLASATMTSVNAFALNLETMVLWGAMIVALTLVGIATLMVGLVFVMPVLGYATWHAYRELVK